MGILPSFIVESGDGQETGGEKWEWYAVKIVSIGTQTRDALPGWCAEPQTTEPRSGACCSLLMALKHTNVLPILTAV